MAHGHLSRGADKCPGVFSAPLLKACGKDVQWCRRQRLLTPCRLGLALTATCASQRVAPLADLHCGVKALLGTPIPYKAFSKQVAPPRFADCARTMPERLMREMPLTVRGCETGGAVSACRRIVRQDGRAWALHDGLREVLPGRFKTVQPAAVEFPTPMDLLCDAPTTGVLPPDTTNAQTFLPEPASLRESGLVAARGYGELPYGRPGQEAGGFVRIRAQAGMHPQVLEAWRDDGTRGRSLRQQPLQTIHAKLPQRQRVARVVQWPVAGRPLGLRLSFRWTRRTKRCCSVRTNLPSHRSPGEGSWRAYQWRGHVEGLLKAWKSYAKVQAFDTAQPPLVEGGLGTAMAAAALQRFLAPMPPLRAEGPMATRQGAMCALHVVGTLVEAVKRGALAGV